VVPLTRQDTVVNIVTRLWAGRSGVRTPANESDFSVQRNIQGSGAYSAFCSLGSGFLGGGGAERGGGQSGVGVKLTTHLHLASRFKMSGAITLLPHMPSGRGLGQLYMCLWLFQEHCLMVSNVKVMK
jgi:hypothetical protein